MTKKPYNILFKMNLPMLIKRDGKVTAFFSKNIRTIANQKNLEILF